MIKDLNDCEPAECYQLDSAVRELAADPLLNYTVKIESANVFFELYRKQMERLEEIRPQFTSLIADPDTMPNCDIFQQLNEEFGEVYKHILRLDEIAGLLPVDQHQYTQLREEKNEELEIIYKMSDRANALCKLEWSYNHAREEFPAINLRLRICDQPDDKLLDSARMLHRAVDGHFKQLVASVIKKLEDIETYQFITTSQDKDLVIKEIQKANPEVKNFLKTYVITTWENQGFDGNEIDRVIQALPE
jgi:hypothetical protein